MSSCVCCYPTNSCERDTDTGRGCACTSDQMDHANNACVASTEAKGSAAPVMMKMTEIVSPTSRPNQSALQHTPLNTPPHWTLSGLVTKQTPFLEKHTHPPHCQSLHVRVITYAVLLIWYTEGVFGCCC
jgi:hypothetical protein